MLKSSEFLRKNETLIDFTLHINRKNYDVEAMSDTPLLFVLRNNLNLTGSKLGCGSEQCGACAVLVNGESTFSCAIAASSLVGKSIITIEGVSESGTLSAIQKAFLTEIAAQCGYCTPGMIIATTALFDKNPSPKKQDILKALQKHLCRCGSHARILTAINNMQSDHSQND